MALWKLVPSTHETDPRWQDRPVYAEVVVRADTAGRARLLAGRYELGVHPDDTGRAVGNGSEPLGSALEDEKLYQMLRVDDPTAVDGPEGVLSAVPGYPRTA